MWPLQLRLDQLEILGLPQSRQRGQQCFDVTSCPDATAQTGEAAWRIDLQKGQERGLLEGWRSKGIVQKGNHQRRREPGTRQEAGSPDRRLLVLDGALENRGRMFTAPPQQEKKLRPDLDLRLGAALEAAPDLGRKLAARMPEEGVEQCVPKRRRAFA
ncbi:hypothetical protein D7Y13_05140 [Corallococcus praedator]|uniref:Uncharacterized protein n=1 Tax=Corallococcus praedator TaxID=2316724 RepID=A0ABX9QPU7_9BACT|nr:hypothetical protein D7X74_07375 [Corallococcus sp. CA047B]RKH33705.1 hypothetical protein D7X75_11085 [Corallococcus sp. CA031C]RKI14905.1 hypothetical protein D7Y13_05140 [Corallococcus praedator]